jgi:imidazolonepropionase-like amidohydrolase
MRGLLRKAFSAGVRIAYGTDAGVAKHGRNADALETLVKYGIPPAQALKAATVSAAELLGLEKEIGTIEPGKSADIVAVDGDPLSDIKTLKTIKFVMVRGEVVVTP